MEKAAECKVMIEKEKIAERIEAIAKEINNDYKGERLIVVGILKGSFMFLSDLIKHIETDTEVYFMKASSYGSGTASSRDVKITTDVERDISGENVLIIEDIIDSGFTMKRVMEIFRGRNPKSLKLCSCLSKPSRREVEVNIDYLGFEIPDEFVVGYGLDYAEKYRNLPYIGILSL